jgi:hypothetical protein
MAMKPPKEIKGNLPDQATVIIALSANVFDEERSRANYDTPGMDSSRTKRFSPGDRLLE